MLFYKKKPEQETKQASKSKKKQTNRKPNKPFKHIHI